MTTSPDVSDDRLVGVSEVVRRVVAARVRDPHLVEDLTQETLVKVAAVAGSLGDESLQAYAAVTARNTVIGHARADAVHDRHAHRLVEYTSLDGPEARALEREETEALAAGLQQLDPVDRRLLLRHEADGTSVETLASEAGSSTNAMKMRLVRARASLRVEFLLAFRRVSLPTQRCRPVLLAMSAGDRRRQAALDAAGHLLRCSTCAELARPVTERRRGIAAWLVVPVAEAVRRAWNLMRRHGPQLAVAATLVAAVTAVTAVSLRSDPDQQHTTATPLPVAPTTVAAAPADPVTATLPAPSTIAASSPLPAAPATTAVPAAAAPAPCPPPVPLEQLDPLAALGCPFAATALTATDVPSDEGFWAVTSTGWPVWVQLVGVGESPLDVDPNDVVVTTGMITPAAALDPSVADPRIVDAGFFVQVTFTEMATG